MSLKSCLKALVELSASELDQLQVKIEEEKQRRLQRKFRDLLAEWCNHGSKDSPRAVKSMVVSTDQGWNVVYVVFHGVNHEVFRAIHWDKDQARELAAEQAIKRSTLIASTIPDPMVIG